MNDSFPQGSYSYLYASNEWYIYELKYDFELCFSIFRLLLLEQLTKVANEDKTFFLKATSKLEMLWIIDKHDKECCEKLRVWYAMKKSLVWTYYTTKYR